MPIQYSTEARLPGPWLLEDEVLKQFDGVIDDEWNRLENRRESLIMKELEERLQRSQEQGRNQDISDDERNILFNEYRENVSYTLRRSKRSVEIKLKSGGTYKTEKFISAIRDDTLRNEVATGFSFDIESADIRCRMDLSDSPNELRIDVSPENT